MLTNWQMNIRIFEKSAKHRELWGFFLRFICIGKADLQKEGETERS